MSSRFICTTRTLSIGLLVLVAMITPHAAPASDRDATAPSGQYGYIFDPADPAWQLIRNGDFVQDDPGPAIAAPVAPRFMPEPDRDREWTVLFYDDAEFDNGWDALYHLTEAAYSSENLAFLVLQDRIDSPAFLWRIDGDGQRTLLEEMGEIDMGAGDTVRDFVQYGKDNYPANRYLACFYDHGSGYQGACIDMSNPQTTMLSMNEFETALTEAGGIDIIAFTAPCLMGAVESVYELKDCVDVYIGSQDLSSYYIWTPITDDICDLLDDSALLSNAEIGAEIVDLIETNFPGSEIIWTMSATAAEQMAVLVQLIDDLAVHLDTNITDFYLDIVAARADAWVMGSNSIPDYNLVDLGSIVTRLQQEIDDPWVDAKCIEILNALSSAMIAQWQTPSGGGANGLSIYFPRTEFMQETTYDSPYLNFSRDTHWNEFIQTYFDDFAHHIDGTVTDAATHAPLAGVTVTLRQTGERIVTGPDGRFYFDVQVGLYHVDVAAYTHDGATQQVHVTYGYCPDLDFALGLRPLGTVVGRVTDQTGTPLAGVRCAPTNPILPTLTTGADGKFVYADVPIGADIGITLDGLPYLGADFLPVNSETTAPMIWPVHAQLAAATHTFAWWFENFNVGDGWNHGRPTVGPGTAFSDTTCLGIGMDGAGFAAADTFLMTGPPAVNYSGHEELYLSFHYWCDLEEGHDGVKLQYREAIGDWFDIEPLGGYSHDQVAVFDGASGWSGDSGGWRGAVFDLSDYTEDYILYRWVLISDADHNDGFFLIDDVTYDTGDSLSPVPEGTVPPAVSAPRISAWPNPFNPGTSLHWSIDRPGHLAVEIYDARGRLIRTLFSGHSDAVSGVMEFDGRDGRGRSLASGAYLVRITDSGGYSSTTRMSLVK